jgi:hypothetical protein
MGGRPWAELWPTVPATALADPEAYAAFTPPGGDHAHAAVLDRHGTRWVLHRLNC